MTQQNQNYCTPFREFLKKDPEGFFHIRLGPKTYLVKATKRIDQYFNWNAVLVIDPKSKEPRPITDEELLIKWVKPNLKALVNYKIAIKQYNQPCNRIKYGKEQRMMYRSKIGVINE